MHVRLTESRPDKEILEYEIIRSKRKKPDYYKHLANTLDYKQIKELTYLAITHKNLEALMGLLKANVYAATDALDTEDGVKFFSEKAAESGDFMPEVYFFIRRPISEKYKSIFRRLARQSILKLSLKITSKGIRGEFKKTVPYYQIGMPEFSIDETIQHNPLKIYSKNLNYKDIYGIERKRQKRKVALVLDTSGSMYGRLLLNAALTASVLAYNMEKEDFAIVLFNSTAMVMKKINQKKPIITIIDDILDSEATGFTNIFIGLEKGLKELNKTKENRKGRFGILITDGNYNRGDDPITLAKKYPKLHVIGMPAENDADQGIQTCKDIAKAGRGKFYAVNDYKEIPRALMELLYQT
ncbi:MAG: VWA domain-containing protein [Promethearchaeota archaeon]